MRKIYWTEQFETFYREISPSAQEKMDYILGMIKEIYVVNKKFVKKLENTEFYEIRISVDNEYRVVLFTIDNDSFILSTKVLLLNGFIKKSTKDYKAQIDIAKKIKTSYYETKAANGEDNEA